MQIAADEATFGEGAKMTCAVSDLKILIRTICMAEPALFEGLHNHNTWKTEIVSNLNMIMVYSIELIFLVGVAACK